MVLGRLGGGLGGILVPRRSKVEKKTKTCEFVDPPKDQVWDPKSKKQLFDDVCLCIYGVVFLRFDFSLILSDFRVRN